MIFAALLSGRAKATMLLRDGTEEQKKLAQQYIKAEDKMVEFYQKKEKKCKACGKFT